VTELSFVKLWNHSDFALLGWADGKIRAFRPQSGKLSYGINDAHQGAVTAIASSNDGKKVISGGADGRVRVWAIEKETQRMLCSLKEHKGAVTCVQVPTVSKNAKLLSATFAALAVSYLDAS
jgi:WD40 repeat protein